MCVVIGKRLNFILCLKQKNGIYTGDHTIRGEVILYPITSSLDTPQTPHHPPVFFRIPALPI